MEKKTELYISGRAAVAALAFLVVFVGAGVAVLWAKDGAARGGRTPGSQVEAAVPRAASADGIDVVVDDVREEDGAVVVLLQLNNHRYDLSDPAIAERSSLDDRPATGFSVLSSGMGGHHVTAEMRFDGPAAGTLGIGVTEDTVLTIAL